VLAIVLLEAAAIGLLGLLVAGLLRSHAEILRQLHHLGGGLDLSGAPPVRHPPPRSTSGRPAGSERRAVGSLVGQTPGGEVVSLALDRPGQRTMLLFLSSGCGTCAAWWEGLRAGTHTQVLPGTEVIVVARDAAEESPSLLVGMAPADVPVVLASAAWEAFSVPGSPYAVLVDGADAAVIGEGVAHSWEQLGSLVGQHLGDVVLRGRERRADADLRSAGIHPGHPSLRPEPGSWTRTGT
jgi:hypothetical protein